MRKVRVAVTRPALPMLAGLVLVAAPGAVWGQVPPGVEREPAAARVAFDDLDRFAAVYRRLMAATDTASLLDSAYFADATVGLRTYAGMYAVDAASILHALRDRSPLFERVALEGPVAVRGIEEDIRAAYRRLAQRYPPALFPPVFFLVGRGHAGGAVQPQGILIAAETYADTARERDFFDLVHLVAHELTHFQQAAYDVRRYQTENSLLARAIKEGVADYVAELLTGKHINPRAHDYGTNHEWALWSRFRCEMRGEDTGDWFFSRPENPDWPQDLGYFIGYRIATARYARETFPERALAALLRVDDYPAFLQASGYEAFLEGRERREFGACPQP